MGWRTVAAVLDGGTAVCGAVCSAYFFDRFLFDADVTPARRVALGLLALLTFGAFIEAVTLLAISTGGREEIPLSAPWAAVRLLPFLGTAGVAALIARRFAAR